MGLCTNSNYRLNNPGQELFGSCPGDFKSFKNQYSIKKIQTSKHNEIFLLNIYDKGYILKRAINNNYRKYNDKKLIREGKLLRELDNDKIVKCLFINDNNSAYIILEYLEGYTLEYILKKFRVNINKSCEIVHRILEGVQYLHKNHIIHNDLNPSNIIYSKDNKIKIIDLGIATYINSNETRLGAEQFSSPEQLLKKESTIKTDIWGVGCILYYLIEGHRPFKGNKEQLEIKPVIKTKVPIQLKHLIISMLERDSVKRPSIKE
ncbi:serine/threonine-protein kinase, partial [Staphylococcus pseudintermedius]|nr:serine/threonine-protein kinase [Staphylococcus pseudintermedius]